MPAEFNFNSRNASTKNNVHVHSSQPVIIKQVPGVENYVLAK